MTVEEKAKRRFVIAAAVRRRALRRTGRDHVLPVERHVERDDDGRGLDVERTVERIEAGDPLMDRL